MKREYSVTTVTCDACGAVIPNSLDAAKVMNIDLCKTCLIKANQQYLRLIEGLVPDRRGGYRALGEYDT